MSSYRANMVASENLNKDDNTDRYASWERGLPTVEELAPLNRTIITPILACAFSINEDNHRQERTEVDAERAAQATLDNLYESIRMSNPRVAEPVQNYQSYSMASGGTREIPLGSLNNNPPMRMMSIVESDNGERVTDSSNFRGSPQFGASHLLQRPPDLRPSIEDSLGRNASGNQRMGSVTDEYGNWRTLAEEANTRSKKSAEKSRESSEKVQERSAERKDASSEGGQETEDGFRRGDSDRKGSDRSKSKDLKGREGKEKTAMRDSQEDDEEKKSMKSSSPDSSHKMKKSRLTQSSEEEGADHEAVSRRDSSPQNWTERGENGADDGSKTLKRPRLVWTPQLHKRFVDAVSHLGLKNAVPKTIMQLMNVSGLTRENVASHLQKYRLYLKRMEQGNSSDGPMSSEQLFATTPIPPGLVSTSQAPQRFYSNPREEIPLHPAHMPQSHLFLGQFPYGVGVSSHPGFEGYSAYNHPMSTGQLMQRLPQSELRGEDNRERERERRPSSPPSTVLTLFPGGGK